MCAERLLPDMQAATSDAHYCQLFNFDAYDVYGNNVAENVSYYLKCLCLIGGSSYTSLDAAYERVLSRLFCALLYSIHKKFKHKKHT